MKAWIKGAIAGFVLGFIHWTYAVIRIWNLDYYQFVKYSTTFYSFFYGVILVGVFAGLLVYIWAKWEKWLGSIMFGVIWGIFSVIILGIAGSEGASMNEGYIILLSFPAWISSLFFEIFPDPPRGLPVGIGLPLIFLMVMSVGPVICISFVSLSSSIGYRISKLIGRMRTK